jgi:hypothetical protein
MNKWHGQFDGYYTYNLASIISCSLNFDFNLKKTSRS